VILDKNPLTVKPMDIKDIKVLDHQRRQFGPHKATMTRTGSPQRPTIGLRIEAGDALAIEGETSLELKGISVADMILFDLA